MKNGGFMLKEFKAFLMQGDIVSLAVAVVIGGAFGLVVASLVADLITPLIGAIFGQSDFSALNFKINGSRFDYGNFINALLAFVTVAFAIFFFVVKPLSKIMKKADDAPDAQEVLLTDIKALLAEQNSTLGAIARK
jgi:large conductance mechanosensitive channel